MFKQHGRCFAVIFVGIPLLFSTVASAQTTQPALPVLTQLNQDEMHKLVRDLNAQILLLQERVDELETKLDASTTAPSRGWEIKVTANNDSSMVVKLTGQVATIQKQIDDLDNSVDDATRKLQEMEATSLEIRRYREDQIRPYRRVVAGLLHDRRKLVGQLNLAQDDLRHASETRFVEGVLPDGSTVVIQARGVTYDKAMAMLPGKVYRVTGVVGTVGTNMQIQSASIEAIHIASEQNPG